MPKDKNSLHADYVEVKVALKGPTTVMENTRKKLNYLKLFPPYPNPFRKYTNIRFSIPFKGKVQLNIYDASGRRIKTLLNKELKKGVYTIRWNGKDNLDKKVKSGNYFVHLKFKNRNFKRKILLLD